MTERRRIKVTTLEQDCSIAREMIRIWNEGAEAKAASYVETHIELRNYDAARQWFRILTALGEVRVQTPNMRKGAASKRKAS